MLARLYTIFYILPLPSCTMVSLPDGNLSFLPVNGGEAQWQVGIRRRRRSTQGQCHPT